MYKGLLVTMVTESCKDRTKEQYKVGLSEVLTKADLTRQALMWLVLQEYGSQKAMKYASFLSKHARM